MRYIILLLLLTSCTPPSVVCDPYVDVEGTSRSSVFYNLNAACSSVQEKFPDVDLVEEIKKRDIKLVVYSPSFFGDGPHVSENCTHYRSGTCTTFKADGSIVMEVRRDENESYKVIHEMKHVALYLSYPELPVTDHHEWMAKNKMCSHVYDSCGMDYTFTPSF